ncbi:MAG: hypothetical protein ABI843_13100 [Dokdonella sp.]
MSPLDDTSVRRPTLGDWSMLAGRADEWSRAYLILSVPSSHVALSPLIFAAAHAVELYLKSAVTAHASFKIAVGFGHKMSELWRYCEALQGFPFKGLLDSKLLDQGRDIYSVEGRQSLSATQRAHLIENEAMYLAIRHVQDLKYLGVKGTTLKGTYALTFGLPVPDRTMIGRLTGLAHWTWGQWWNTGGYNDPSLYALAERVMSAGQLPRG